MARHGRRFPNRPTVLRANPRPDRWIVSGAAAMASSAGGALAITQQAAGAAPMALSASGMVGLVQANRGYAPLALYAGGALTIIGPNLEAMAQAEVSAETTRILRRVDIYEHDAETLWLEDADALEWSVSLSDGGGPRRTCTATLNGDDGALLPSDDGFGFDKVLKLYRGVVLSERDDEPYWWPVGVFDVEPITTRQFPRDVVAVSGYDFAGRVNRASFDTVTTYTIGQSVEDVVRQIAEYAGITRFRLEHTGRLLTRDFTIEPGTYLWDAIEELVAANGCEAFFDATGYLVVRIILNASERPTSYSFAGGAGGNLVDFVTERSREAIFNHWPVRGESSDQDVPPVYASAENDEPTSPTAVSRIGRQSAPVFSSSAITTEEEALIVAESRRALGAVRARTATITALVAPWLDIGDVVAVTDPNPAELADETERWQLTSFGFGSALGATDYSANRAEYVGERSA